MPNDKLDMLFRHCINGTGPDGWSARQSVDQDFLSNKDGHSWVRQSDPLGQWIDTTNASR